MSQSRFAEAIAALATALEGHRWYLFGAQAAILYGAPRMSEDVDATVFLNDGSTAASILPLLEAGGFRPTVLDADFFEQTRVVPAIHGATGIPVDLVVGGPGLEESFYARRGMRRIGGQDVPVIALEDLVALKVLAGRDRDRDDVRSLLAVRPDLDTERVRETLALLDEALALGELVMAFDRLASERDRSR